jgi:hypothetical protein
LAGLRLASSEIFAQPRGEAILARKARSGRLRNIVAGRFTHPQCLGVNLRPIQALLDNSVKPDNSARLSVPLNWGAVMLLL